MLNVLLIGENLKELGKIGVYLSDHFGQSEVRLADNENDVFDKVHEKLPDIILLDFSFKQNAGPDFCNNLKNKSITQHIPVVLITESQTSSEQRIKGLLAGADSLISKPVDKAELMAVVNVMLRVRDAEEQLRKKNIELKEKVSYTTQELKRKDKRYADMFDAAANIIILIGKNKLIEEWNKAAEELFEVKKSDAVGKKFEKLLLNKVMISDINDKIAEGDEISEKNEYQINIKTNSGKKYQVLWSISKLTDSQNRLSSILVIGQDVTLRVKEQQERKRSDAKLLKNYLFLDTLMDSLPSPIYYKNTEGKYLGCNHDFADIFDLKPDDIIGKYTADINPQPFAKQIIEEDKQVFMTGEKQVKEVISGNKAGKMKYFILNKTAYYDPDGSVGGLVGVLVEVTKLKMMEEEIRESEMFFKGMTDSANDAIILIDRGYKVYFWNKAAEILFGYKKEEAINGLIYKILTRESKKVFNSHVAKIHVKDKKPTKANIIELEAVKKNNKKIPVTFSISSIRFHKKDFVIIVATDISSWKNTEAELLEAKEQAIESDRLKSAFLSNMSHEIRTPMNAIVGFAQLLTNPKLSEEKRQVFIEQINLNSESLLQLIEDIINVSKIEAGKIEIKKTMCLMNNVLDELHTSFTEHKRRMDKEHLELNIFKAIDNPNFSVLTDNQRFKQIMSNLIGNAIKFTEKGNVSFGYEVKDEDFLQFYVKDTGLGIKKEKLKYVFDRFTKISANKTKLYGGTGLGLSITQHLVKRLGGEIWVESVEGEGSDFYFTLPYQGADMESKQVKFEKEIIKNMSLKNTNILIAEDEQMNYYFLLEALESTGANIEWAKNGHEAVQFVEKNNRFDVVLMDMKMPVMDGYEATAKIKKMNPALPIIAQTAYAMPEEQEKGYRAGCDFYLSKPIDADLLINTIKKYIKEK